jgi:hypothetical protein
MLELKKQLIAAYLEFSGKCKCENCTKCLYVDAPLPQCEAFLLADFLVASGLFTVPAAPGPSDADPNIMELCFHNGERHMKEKIANELTRIAEIIPCITVAQAIAMIEGL